MIIQDHLSNTMNIFPNQTSTEKIEHFYSSRISLAIQRTFVQIKILSAKSRITSATTMNIGLNQPSNQKIEHFNSSSISSTMPWTFAPIKTLNVFIQDNLINTMNICLNQTSNQNTECLHPGSLSNNNGHLSESNIKSKHWTSLSRITAAIQWTFDQIRFLMKRLNTSIHPGYL